MLLTLLGILIGFGVAVSVGGEVGPLLFDVSPWDPVVYAQVAACMLGIAVLAAAGPSWRASHTNPSTALRAES